jgi:hypothetical protein
MRLNLTTDSLLFSQNLPASEGYGKYQYLKNSLFICKMTHLLFYSASIFQMGLHQVLVLPPAVLSPATLYFQRLTSACKLEYP